MGQYYLGHINEELSFVAYQCAFEHCFADHEENFLEKGNLDANILDK